MATMAMATSGKEPSSGMAMPSTGDYVDLHELAKGWKAAIARAKDPATRYERRNACQRKQASVD